jgi:hypothetical protein
LQSSVYKERPELRGVDGLTWEALRLDLVKCAPELEAARGELAVGGDLEAWVGDNVSNLRLLDMCAWQD